VDRRRAFKLDPTCLGLSLGGHRHLGYLQSKLGFAIKRDMPQLKGAVVARLTGIGPRPGSTAQLSFPPE